MCTLCGDGSSDKHVLLTNMHLKERTMFADSGDGVAG